MSRMTPPPASGRLDAPALQMRRQIDRMEDPGEQRLADAPFCDRVAHGAVGRGVAQMMVGAHDDAAPLAFGDHRAGVGQGQRQRLLAHHVLSRRRGGKELIAMQLVGRRDIDGVDILRLDERRELVVECAIPCSRAYVAARSAFELITATTSPPFARMAPIMCSARSCSRRSVPTAVWSCASLSSLAFEAPHDARMTKSSGSDVSGSKSPLAI